MAALLWLLFGIVLLLCYGVAKGLIIPRLHSKRVQGLSHRLSVSALYLSAGMIVLGMVLMFDQFLLPYPWYRNARWPIFLFLIGAVIVIALSVIGTWVLTSITLRHSSPLEISALNRKAWYIVTVRPDFAKSPRDRITCPDVTLDEVLRTRPALGKPRQLTPQNHIILLDGTWNDAESDTNVCRLFQLLRDTCDNGEPQIARYYTGVGINENQGIAVDVLGGQRTKGIIQSATGLGERGIRWMAYLDLVATYQPGDRLFIFGFSRGASSARILANHIHEYGIPELVQAKFQRMSTGPDELRFLAISGGKKGKVEIEMMGLWDTVAAFGLPSNKFEPFRRLSIPDNVKKVYHLVAIDEKRWAFDATLIDHHGRDGRFEEIWFAGAHTNVGGGSGDRRLSDIALRFMINRASEQGICFKKDWEKTLEIDERGPEWPLWRLYPPWLFSRTIRVKGGDSNIAPRIHKSVFERKRLGIIHDPFQPGKSGIISKLLRRKKPVSTYDPPNLRAVERKYSLEERN